MYKVAPSYFDSIKQSLISLAQIVGIDFGWKWSELLFEFW